MSPKPPPLSGVLETVLYFTDQQATETFYQDVLGMRLVGREPGRSLFFRAGGSVFLLFHAENARHTATAPPHGARGPIHCCFRVAADAYPAWKAHLAARGVKTLKEIDWERGLSFYFHDPHGNVLEIANADIWPP
jgi:catechol 2,3-dioxygenase-like lactoylglutathione lyase family enzyme